MNKKINVLGVELDNYTVRESMLKVDSYLNNTVLNTMQIISMEMLVLCDDYPKMKDCIEKLDLSIIGDREILSATNIESSSRHKEVADNIFMGEFVKRLIKNNRIVYVIGDSQEKIECFKNYIKSKNMLMNIMGESVVDINMSDTDEIVNNINSICPDVIISLLPSPQQEKFIIENKSRLLARILIGMGSNYKASEENGKIFDKISQLINKSIFKRKVTRFNNEEDD